MRIPSRFLSTVSKTQFSRLVRFVDNKGTIQYGDQSMSGRSIKTRIIRGDIFQKYEICEEVNPAKYLAPIDVRGIIGVGLNYRLHAIESQLPIPKYPVIFYKNLSTIIGPYESIRIPPAASILSDPHPLEVDYECELAIIIGKHCKDVPKEKALNYVFGYTCANDVTCRYWQFHDGPASQWNRGKSFDTFLPIGPCIVNAELIPNPNQLTIKTTLNGKVMQDSNTSDMIFDVPTIISYLSESTTLLPGTVIITGTPAGVGFKRNPPVFLKAGDEVTISIEKIGQLINSVE